MKVCGYEAGGYSRTCSSNKCGIAAVAVVVVIASAVLVAVKVVVGIEV